MVPCNRTESEDENAFPSRDETSGRILGGEAHGVLRTVPDRRGRLRGTKHRGLKPKDIRPAGAAAAYCRFVLGGGCLRFLPSSRLLRFPRSHSVFQFISPAAIMSSPPVPFVSARAGLWVSGRVVLMSVVRTTSVV